MQIFNATEESLNHRDDQMEDEDEFHFERPEKVKRKSKISEAKKKKARQLEFFDFEWLIFSFLSNPYIKWVY